MIVIVRLDERMIHGQVAIKWSRHMNIERIIVGNKEASENDIIQKSLMMAAPSTCKVAIKDIDGTIALLNDPRGKNLRMMCIVSNPDDLLKVAQNVKDIDLINIGNYGRIASKRGDQARKTYNRNLYAYDDEVETLKKVIETGIKCVFQTTPDETPESLSKILGL